MGTYEISVDHTFTAGHALPLDGSLREQTHQHTWRVTVAFRSDKLTEQMGVVADFVEVTDALKNICSRLEGANLNDLEEFSHGKPSAEYVAEYIARALAGPAGLGKTPFKVEVTEAPGCKAAFYP